MHVFYLGGHNAADALLLAKDSFRSICFTDLSSKDFIDNKDTCNVLYKKTIKTTLGMADAFVSHSWHDDGNEKYRVLEKWSLEFKRKTGREPQLWIDKVQKAPTSDTHCHFYSVVT